MYCSGLAGGERRWAVQLRGDSGPARGLLLAAVPGHGRLWPNQVQHPRRSFPVLQRLSDGTLGLTHLWAGPPAWEGALLLLRFSFEIPFTFGMKYETIFMAIRFDFTFVIILNFVCKYSVFFYMSEFALLFYLLVLRTGLIAYILDVSPWRRTE